MGPADSGRHHASRHPTILEGMKGVLRPTELEEDGPEGVDACPQFDVWELADPSQEHLRGRVIVGCVVPLDVGGSIHPERIETQRNVKIPYLDHRLLCSCEVEAVASSSSGAGGVCVEQSHSTDHLGTHPLHLLMRDEVQRVILNILPESQTFGWLQVKTDNPLLGVDLCGDGPKNVCYMILASPL